MISNEQDLATLVAEKLYQKVKDDLITSGTGIINEVLTTDLSFLFLLTKIQIFSGVNRTNWNEAQVGRTPRFD